LEEKSLWQKILPWAGWVLFIGKGLYDLLVANPPPSEAAEAAVRLIGG
jgi:hypothetical protein